MKKKILYSLVAILVLIQLFRINKENPKINISDDFIAITNPPKEITMLIKSSCYDCHSSESKYPWYSNVAPISWWVKYHINEGRAELNFSKWSTYSLKKKDHKLEEMIEEIEEGEMPLKPYPLTHPEAQLSSEQIALLTNWLKETKASLNKPQEKETLALNNGEKWQTNPETTDGILRMITIINTTDLSPQKKGENLNVEMKTIFAECTMKGEAHDQLHLFLIPLVKMFRVLKETTPDEAGEREQEIRTYLKEYSTYFK